MTERVTQRQQEYSYHYSQRLGSNPWGSQDCSYPHTQRWAGPSSATPSANYAADMYPLYNRVSSQQHQPDMQWNPMHFATYSNMAQPRQAPHEQVEDPRDVEIRVLKLRAAQQQRLLQKDQSAIDLFKRKIALEAQQTNLFQRMCTAQNVFLNTYVTPEREEGYSPHENQQRVEIATKLAAAQKKQAAMSRSIADLEASYTSSGGGSTSGLKPQGGAPVQVAKTLQVKKARQGTMSSFSRRLLLELRRKIATGMEVEESGKAAPAKAGSEEDTSNSLPNENVSRNSKRSTSSGGKKGGKRPLRRFQEGKMRYLGNRPKGIFYQDTYDLLWKKFNGIDSANTNEKRSARLTLFRYLISCNSVHELPTHLQDSANRLAISTSKANKKKKEERMRAKKAKR